MFDSYRFKQWVSLSIVRAHLCTLAVAMGFNSWWRIPRDAFRFGGMAYGLAHTVALVLVAMPIALLQLAVGQLSQQDAVGMWRAVPFLRGVGYLRLLITSLGSIYTSVYLALTATNFFYTLSNPYPTWECTELIPEDIYETPVFNTSLLCYNETLLAPIADQPENYIAIALIICALWIVFPFMLYNPIKFLKRIFYILNPVIIIFSVVIVSFIGDWSDLTLLHKKSDWSNYLGPDIWFAAVIQALWSSQVAGAYLVSSGDTVYSNTNVQWTTFILIGINITINWMALAFWFAISGSGEKNTNALAILFQIYNMAAEKELDRSWPIVIFVMLFLSGIITMLTLLYPLYDRFRRMGGPRWRIIVAVSSVVGGSAALAVLAGRLPVLYVIEDVATPLLISIATILEIFAFIFIYGWKILVEDVEFLTGHPLSKSWVTGWCVAPGVLAPFTAWWIAKLVIQNMDWDLTPWETITLIIAAGCALVTLVTSAAVAVAKQVQYDFVGKLKSSFKPSRHWGPRDPITHYYWLARRDEVARRNCPRSRYHRRFLGQLSGRPSFLQTEAEPPSLMPAPATDPKRRTNSDDWIYTVQRRQGLKSLHDYNLPNSERRRSKSLDWEYTENGKKKDVISFIEFTNTENVVAYFLDTKEIK